VDRRPEYLKEIENNFFNIDRDELEEMYGDVSEAGCIIPFGSGRSYYAVIIGTSFIAPYRPLYSPEDVGFPGHNIKEAAPILEERFKKVSLWIVSGSGKSKTPLHIASDLADYIEKTGSKSFTIDVITSNPASPLGKLGRKYGSTVRLAGRTEKEASLFNTPRLYSKVGIMGDVFELGALALTRFMVQAICEGAGVNRVYELGEEVFPMIDRIIEETISLPAYNRTLEILEQPHILVFGGMGASSGGVASMSAIRFSHIKRALGDSVYVVRGENTPRPRAGDLGIMISRSGESPSTIEWFKTMKENDARITAIVGDGESTLAKNADFPLVLGVDYFYIKAAYLCSVLALHLCERLAEKGYPLPEFILEWYHSVTE